MVLLPRMRVESENHEPAASGKRKRPAAADHEKVFGCARDV